ncbi:MAG: CRISPR-associated endonuclease Cas1, partial [Acidimicrobiales bacterium]
SAPRLADDARLRRQQALAPLQPVGLGVARYLLSAKLRGQAGLLKARFGKLSEAETIEALAEAVEAGGTVDVCRQLEASAANAYFGAWAGHPAAAPTFVAKDRARVPAHWRVYEGRRSILRGSGGNRKAATPTNAILNYAFSLLEAEAVLACQVVGLDPGLGVVHLDAKGRQSMALDVLEPVRPQVEGMVLDLLSRRPFRKADSPRTPRAASTSWHPLPTSWPSGCPRWPSASALGLRRWPTCSARP